MSKTALRWASSEAVSRSKSRVAEPALLQHGGHVAVAWAVPAAAAAVGEEHHFLRPRGDGQVARELGAGDGDADLTVLVRVLGHQVPDHRGVLCSRSPAVAAAASRSRAATWSSVVCRSPRRTGRPRRSGTGARGTRTRRPRASARDDGLPGPRGRRVPPGQHPTPAPRRMRPGPSIRGDAVVDDHSHLAVEREPLGRRAEPVRPLLDDPALALGHGGELHLADVQGLHDLVVDDGHPTLADGAHGELRLEGHAQLAHDDDVERSAEGGRDLGRDGHAAARQPEHDGVGPR